MERPGVRPDRRHARAGTDRSPDRAGPARRPQAGPRRKGTGDIVVVGTRASLQSAIQRKRNAGTVVDSIVADDIASFPDKNVGDSLARVTGVQLSRDFGEGTQVSIRGVEPDLNRVEVNGVSQHRLWARAPATSANSPPNGQVDRRLQRLSGKPDEGGLGGTVSIETRKPLK